MNGQRNPPKTPWRGMAVVVLAALAAVALAVYYARTVAPALRHGDEAAARNLAVVGAARRLERAIGTAQRGERAFLATGDPRYLDTYRRGAATVPTRLLQLAQLTRGDAEQQRRLGLLRQRLDAWLDDLRGAIANHQNAGFDMGGRPDDGAEALAAMGLISGILDSIVDAAMSGFGARERQAAALADATGRASLLAAEIVLGLALLGGGLSALGLVRTARAQARLRDSEERFRLGVTQVEACAIAMLDPIGRIVTWNAGAERLSGWPAPDVLGRHMSQLYPEDAVRARMPERDLQHAASQGSCALDGWRVRKDGARWRAVGALNAVHGPEGRLRGFALVARDIGEAPAPALAEPTAPTRAGDHGAPPRR